MSQYEGHAAMRLESLVTKVQTLAHGWRIQGNFFDMTPALELLARVVDPVTGANFFHGTLITGLTSWITETCRERKIDMVVLSGGCFINRILADGLTTNLKQSGITSFYREYCPQMMGEFL